jgi:hypothetical protein
MKLQNMFLKELKGIEFRKKPVPASRPSEALQEQGEPCFTQQSKPYRGKQIFPDNSKIYTKLAIRIKRLKSNGKTECHRS